MNNNLKKVIECYPNNAYWIKQLRQIDKTFIPVNKQLTEITQQLQCTATEVFKIQSIIQKQMTSILKLKEKLNFVNDLIDKQSIKITISNINNSLKDFFEKNKYLLGTQLEILKFVNFRKTIFDAIPKQLPTIIKNLRTPTLTFLRKNKSIKLNVEEHVFVYKNYYLNVNQVNEIAIMTKMNSNFTIDFIVKLMEAYKKYGPHYIETKEYKELEEYLKKDSFIIKINNKYFFRGVKNNTNIDYDEERMRNNTFGYPKMGRYNFAGFNFLYVSDKKIGPKQELLLHSNNKNFKVQLAMFENDIKIAMFDVDNKNIDSILQKQIKLKLNDEGKNVPNEYIISAIISDCIKYSKLAEGIKYSAGEYTNFVFYNTKLFKYTNLGIFDVNNIND